MRGSLGASSSKSKGSSGSGSNPVAARAPPAKKKGGKRGAPQTFASKLFNVLQAAEGKKGSPVSWCLEGNSFTVHNDKDFETQVLTANYRHGKFSSFQRQLNMYGFRKVADCSDRTYSHPFFRRDQSDLLAQVRRVVNDTVGAANANATFSPSGNPVVKRPAHALAPSVRRPKLQQAGGRKGESADNSESGGGGSRRQAARKKARRCRDVTPSSSSAEFSSVWSRHTGRWDVPAVNGSSLGDDGGTWTTASSSAASSVEEAVSPVLLPTTPASLDCSKSFVPPFRLQQDVSPSLADMCRRNGYGGHPPSSSGAPTNTFGPSNPVLVSPAPVMFGGGGGGGSGGGRDAEVDVLDGRRGDPMPSSTAATFARSSPAMMYHSEAQGPVGQDAPGGGLYIMGGGTGWRGGGGGRGDEGGIPPADEAGHGPTPTRCPSFDKIFGRQEPRSSSHGNQPGMAQLDNPRTAKPGAAIDTGNAVVPVSPTASANATADGWDLACLGGAGWGSPDTTESPAAEVWAAIPPLVAQESCERGVSPRPSPFGGGAGRKGEPSVGGGAAATDPLNWSVLSDDAAKAGMRLGYADEGSMMATGGGGGGVVRRASPPYSIMPPPGLAPLG
ncbi:Putative Heat Shock transcription factor [Ectocarpus siliculosus]|uniref:Heat Shock transcription factor n=1 Tax=Ectocarpus siliculosus TaxID=2880 RepID=D8LDB1_ECTSI|nr:Putative Heat Shock transcription factor [Ectocarpus siliculosus]|eukprot:CBN80169.1 Putative Heat Shock transcription factor [Ectocarpus siliculosus]